MERAILSRHAESEASVLGLLNGVAATAVGLTEAGREQARGMARHLPPVDLVATSEFRRAAETAELAAPAAPRLVLVELNEIGYGAYENGPYASYLAWAGSATAGEAGPGDGESRVAAAARYARALGLLLDRPERTVLVVAHGLFVRYVLDALAGRDPAPLLDDVPCAEPY